MRNTPEATRPDCPGETSPTVQAPITLRVIDGGLAKESQGSTPEPQEGLSWIFEIFAAVMIALSALVLILDWAVPVIAQ